MKFWRIWLSRIWNLIKRYMVKMLKDGEDVKRENVFSYDFWEVFGISKEEAYKRMDKFFETEYFEGVMPVDGAQESIELLSKTNELHVITSRPISIKDKTKEWIERYFGKIFFGIYHTDEYSGFGRRTILDGKKTRKVEVCRELNVNVLIEDSLMNAVQCAQGRGIERVLLMNQPWNQDGRLPEKVKRVYGWNEIIEKIEEMN